MGPTRAGPTRHLPPRVDGAVAVAVVASIDRMRMRQISATSRGWGDATPSVP